MAKITLPLLLLAALVAIVIGFEDRRPRADFVYVHMSDLFTLDPQKMSYQHDLRMAKGIYETLVAIVDARYDYPPVACPSTRLKRSDGRRADLPPSIQIHVLFLRFVESKVPKHRGKRRQKEHCKE